jgi:MFS family permease
VLVLLLGISVLLNYVDRGAIGIAAPGMTSDLKLDPRAFGIVVSAFFWVYAPVQLVVGWLVDRFSVYRLIAAGVLVWAAATLATGFAEGFASLLVLRVMLGIGETIAFPGGSKIITQEIPANRRGLANAIMALGIALGPALGTFAGGLILANYGWRAIFIGFGAVTLVWLLPWSIVIPHHSRPKPEARQSVPLRPLVGRWSLWAMSIAHFASNYIFYFLLSWLPLFLTKSRGLPVREMTLIATLGYAAQAIAAISVGLWSDRWTTRGGSEAGIRRAMMIVGQLVAGAAVLGVAFARSPAEIAVSLCFAGVATGALSLNIYAVAQMFAGPRAAGSWVGFQNALGNLSGIVGPIITGIIVVEAGYQTAFLVTAGVGFAGAVWWAVAVPKIEQIRLD